MNTCMFVDFPSIKRFKGHFGAKNFLLEKVCSKFIRAMIRIQTQTIRYVGSGQKSSGSATLLESYLGILQYTVQYMKKKVAKYWPTRERSLS
jgi:hypothetical protein